jgi:virginiamycin B lyase
MRIDRHVSPATDFKSALDNRSITAGRFTNLSPTRGKPPPVNSLLARALRHGTAFLLCLALNAHAGGSHYGVAAGVPQGFSGKATEWPVPTPEFARDPAPAPDGSIFIAVMNGNKIARFDPATQAFREWDMPAGHHPHGVLVDRAGIAWTTGNRNGTIGRLDPATGRITEFRTSGAGTGPHTMALSDDGATLWFTMQRSDAIGRLDTASGRITEYATSGGPYGITLDKTGNVWWCRMGDDMLGRLDVKSGRIDALDMGRGSRPRRLATAPDGMLWATLYGNGRLAQIDPAANKVVKEYALPGGDAGAYAVTVDGAGIVWVNEIKTDTVVRLDPRTGQMRVIALPSTDVGIRKMIVDGAGRLWYMGSHNGRLGMVE